MENLTPGIQTNDEIGNVQNQESDDTSQNITHALDLTAQKLFVGQVRVFLNLSLLYLYLDSILDPSTYGRRCFGPYFLKIWGCL